MNHYKNNPVMKLSFYVILIVTLLVTQFGFSQNANDKIWEALYNNDRKTALKLVTKIKDKKASDEALILKQIVRVQNGIFSSDKQFFPNFIKKENFDYALFALWNEQFVFKDYLNQSFDKSTFDNINFLKNAPIKNQTVKAGLTYLDAASQMYFNNFVPNQQINNKLLAVSNWQDCGVFENLNDSGINVVYPPEHTAISDTPFNANSNGKINWFISSNNNNNLPYHFMSNYTEYGSGINYAQTFFTLDKEQTLLLKFGIGKDTKIWVNDVLIFEEQDNSFTELDAYTIKVNVPKGTNRILIKTTNSNYTYFILRVFDANNKIINPKELNFTANYNPYNKSTKDVIAPKLIPNEIESYFKNLDTTKYSKYFKNYMLIKTYLRNGKIKKAKKIIQAELKQHPKSSILRTMLMVCYTKEGNKTQVNELTENRKNDDPNYYLVLITEFMDTKKIFNLPIDKMNEKLDKLNNALDLEIVKVTTKLYKNLRAENKKELKTTLDEIYNLAKEQKREKLMSTYANLYTSVFNENDKTQKLFEEINANYLSYRAKNGLIKIYKNNNDKEKVIALQKSFVNKLPEDIDVLEDLITILYSYQEYEQALNYIDKGLKIFPYSFVLMKFKGNILLQLKKEKEALKWYKKSYAHDSGNAKLRKKIRDLEKEDDPFEKLIKKDAYKYIAKNRNKTTDAKYAFNILLNEKNVQLYKEGGSKSRSIYIYEIKSEKGIESLKEYNLNLGYNYTLNKSEIVKPDGKIVPAERSGSNLVFNSLSIGDVIYIDFETFSNKTGRFYKDFYDTFQTSSYVPIYKNIYRLITFKGKTITAKVVNGTLDYNKKKMGDFIIYEWSKLNEKVMAPSENYMPNDYDLDTTLHISTIKSWSEISKWYSDLVRTQIEYNDTVNNLFTKLFPNGYKDISEEERARIIYYYMMNNLTYSYVSFKQSGYVPQKPSKTIKTLLGDCKDFSTLFLILARKAELETNLVLISTSDLGEKYLILPNSGFNHCIVRVMLDGKEQYLELTDNNLPFKTLPSSLDGALALNIPYDANQPNLNSNELIVLKNLNSEKTVYKANIDITIGKENRELTVEYITNGKINSSFRDLLSETNEKKLKKDLTSFFEKKDNLDLTLLSFKIIKNKKEENEVIFKTTFKVNNEIKKLGKLKLLKLPKFSRPYTSNIIRLDKREYPFVYRDYEDVDTYNTNYVITLKDGQKFIEIPENSSFNYKNHHFSISYNKENDNVLKISIVADIDIKTIPASEYKAFKSFVKNVLESLDIFIGYK